VVLQEWKLSHVMYLHRPAQLTTKDGRFDCREVRPYFVVCAALNGQCVSIRKCWSTIGQNGHCTPNFIRVPTHSR
jgi:hypothetical protein